MDIKPKNVPEELKNFLEDNSSEWFTNEQLADRLQQYECINCSTPSGIRNAVTKLKNTGLVKTRMVGSLAYRAWHTAPTEEIPFPDMQKRVPSRKCNGCATTHSRYWRSDLEEKNGWLCNNCGMNQRRGRGFQRVAYIILTKVVKLALMETLRLMNISQTLRAWYHRQLNPFAWTN
jgi:hypothetical protein